MTAMSDNVWKFSQTVKAEVGNFHAMNENPVSRLPAKTCIDWRIGSLENQSVASGPVSTAEKVKALRRELGWSQTVLSEKAKVGRDFVSRLERGETVGMVRLQRIAGALEVPVVELMGLEAHLTAKAEPDGRERLQRIIDAFQDADEADRQTMEQNAQLVENSTAMKRALLRSRPRAEDQAPAAGAPIPTKKRKAGPPKGQRAARRGKMPRRRKTQSDDERP